YDDPVPVGVREAPSRVMLPDGTVNLYANLDASGGGPRDITLDSGGASPTRFYALYDGAGRVIERGEVGRYAEQYDYNPDFLGTVQASRHRLDSASPWIATASIFYWDDTRALPGSIDEPRRTTTIQYLGNQPFQIDRIAKLAQPGEPLAPATATNCYHYSADGRLEDAVLPEGNEIHYDYDAAGR